MTKMACIYLVIFSILMASSIGVSNAYRFNANLELTQDTRQELSLTNYQCCKVGEKLARKGLSCSTYRYANHVTESGKFYVGAEDGHQSKHVQRLSAKAAECLDQYSMNLKKCCNHFEDYKVEMASCKIYRNSAQRKACREGVRYRYPY